jgi:hypothetical protein
MEPTDEGSPMESGPDTDPEQAIERDTENLEQDLERLGDHIDEAKDHAAERAKEAGDDPQGADSEDDD